MVVCSVQIRFDTREILVWCNRKEDTQYLLLGNRHGWAGWKLPGATTGKILTAELVIKTCS